MRNAASAANGNSKNSYEKERNMKTTAVTVTIEVIYQRKRPEKDHSIPNLPNPWGGE